MNSKKPIPMQFRRIDKTMSPDCDICGKNRRGINHPKCSKIRQQRGFSHSASAEMKS